MNAIFLDFEGVLHTVHYYSREDAERRIKILADICHEYDAVVVIASSEKEAIDEVTLETFSSWIQFVFDCFKKYNIKCIGRTPSITKKNKHGFSINIWKEDEIRLFLYRHPEIEHYCVIDDDDLGPRFSDLNKVRNHLVKTINYCRNNPEEEGLLERHKGEVGIKLQEENEIKKLILRRDKEKK